MANRLPFLFLVILPLARVQPADAETKDYPYTPVAFTDVVIADEFWAPRIETNRRRTVWYDLQKCEETGRIANFARAGGLEQGGFEGIPYNDSDVMKVIEGAAYALSSQPDPKLDRLSRRSDRQDRGRSGRRRVPVHGPYAGRQQWFHRAVALVQPPPQSRTVQRRPYVRGRGGSLPGHGQTRSCWTSRSATPT